MGNERTTQEVRIDARVVKSSRLHPARVIRCGAGWKVVGCGGEITLASWYTRSTEEQIKQATELKIGSCCHSLEGGSVFATRCLQTMFLRRLISTVSVEISHNGDTVTI
jgi:hypothetical protein